MNREEEPFKGKGLKWEFIERSMKYVRLPVPFLFIDFSVFSRFLAFSRPIAVNTPHCIVVSQFSDFTIFSPPLLGASK
jgi:hypothetical protein